VKELRKSEGLRRKNGRGIKRLGKPEVGCTEGQSHNNRGDISAQRRGNEAYINKRKQPQDFEKSGGENVGTKVKCKNQAFKTKEGECGGRGPKHLEAKEKEKQKALWGPSERRTKGTLL